MSAPCPSISKPSSEIAAATDRWRRLRFLVAPAADIAAAILIYIHSLPETSRPGYATVSNSVLLALPSALFFIYGASFAWRTIWRRRQTTFFEIAQSIITFTLALFTWLWFYPAAGRFGAGAFCWLLCAACYADAFVVFDRIAEQRNYHVYATYSAALLLAGSFLLLPSFYVALFLTACSVVATLVGLLIGLFQTITQIQEQTLPFGINLVAVILCIYLMSGWTGEHILNYANEVLRISMQPQSYH